MKSSKDWSARIALSVTALILGGVLAGCGGNGSNGGPNTLNLPGGNVNATATPVPNRFAGNFTGTFIGATVEGNPIFGTSTVSVNNQGVATGTVTQNGSTFPGMGTVSDAGVLTLTATPDGAQTSTLSGNVVSRGTDQVATGTLRTVFNGQQVVTGRFFSIRTQAAATPFAGAYTGTLAGTGTSGATFTGNFTGRIDRNGNIVGTVAQQGVATYPVVGIVERSGAVTLIAVSSFATPPPNVFTSNVTGTATTVGSAASITGTFTTTFGSQQNASGTFTATRTGA